MTAAFRDRVRRVNDAAVRAGGDYILYSSQRNRRLDNNHALAFAVEMANENRLPVLFVEDINEPNRRMHTFVVEGVADNRKRCAELGVGYAAAMEPGIYGFADNAAAVVVDDFPGLITPPLEVALFAVDSSCIVPMRCFEKREYAAYTIRPKIRKVLAGRLEPAPRIRVNVRYENAQERICDIADRKIAPSTAFRGGTRAARRRLNQFLKHGLRRYAALKNEPAANGTSNLSPYLRFGHISSLEIALAVKEYAAEHKLIADEFLEELIVRRELAFNFALHSPDPKSIGNLPEWAQRTLEDHASDRRDHLYSREQFEQAQTHDPLWNAAQKEMLLRGKIHGYYRMYWGKKILQWSRTPEEAVAAMIHIHDVWALDGRDPNTYANILWCLGLHDRPWPERSVFGKVRYMSLEGMRRKTDVDAYIRAIEHLERTGDDPLRL